MTLLSQLLILFLTDVLEFSLFVGSVEKMQDADVCVSPIRTAGDSVPAGAVDDVVVLQEVLVVAGPSVRVGHDLVGAGVDRGQPAEEAVVGGGSVLVGGPVPGHVKWVGDHQLSAMQVGTQYKRDGLHPVYHCARFRGDLRGAGSWSKCG